MVDIVDSGSFIQVNESVTFLNITDNGVTLSIAEQNEVVNLQETNFFVQVIENYGKVFEIPVGADLEYNLDGTISTVLKDNGVEISFVYEGGNLKYITDGYYTKELIFTGSNLTRVNVI